MNIRNSKSDDHRLRHVFFARRLMELHAVFIFALITPIILFATANGQESTSNDSKAESVEVDAGHSFHGEAFDEGPRQAAYLMQGMGNVHWKITTKSPIAQRFFDQGVAQLHGFWYFEAERSFRQVAAFDADCAMAYWGMARANTKNEKRARGFIVQADQHKEKVSELERRLIEALKAKLDEKTEGKSIAKKVRMEKYVKTLEEIALDFPNEIELAAMLGLQLWENGKEGLPLQSRRTLEATLNEILVRNPRHPAHHFIIHLWDNTRRDRALKSAAACGPAAPGIAHMWHMPGHTYSGLNRYHDAAWQQEASARVDHAHMMRDRVMPDQIHNFAHNNEWLIRTWIKTGEVHRAIDLAKNMCELPRHPDYNTLDKGSAMFGRSRLISVLTTYGLWEQFLALAETPYLEPTDDVSRQDERLAWLSVAALNGGGSNVAEKHQQELVKRLTDANAELAKITKALQSIDTAQPATKPKPPSTSSKNSKVQHVRAPALDIPIELDDSEWNEVESKVKSQKSRELTWDDAATKNWTKPQQAQAKEHKKLKTRIDKLKTYVALSNAYRAASEKNFGDAIAFARQAGTLVPTHERIEWYALDGRTKTAIAKCRERIKASPGDALPLAIGAWIAWQAEDRKLAKTWLQDFAKIGYACDADLPQIARLQPLIREADLIETFATKPKVPDDLGERPNLDSLGPARWSPYLAPTWELVDSNGNGFVSKQLHGKTKIVIFYLGFGCLHCVEQLQVFSPMLEKFKESEIDVIAISTENVVSLQSALKGYSQTMDIPLIANPDLDLFKSFRCYDDFEDQPLHGTFVIDRSGRVVWQDIGPDPFMDAKFLLGEARRLDAINEIDH
ncbi:MAG: redoxin domain-containing protein [Pirellulaceae bacterium]|nr:redoxin domain-containing protein [Pirellulaceae bacterium]